MARVQLDLKLLDAEGDVLWTRLVTAEKNGQVEDVGGILRALTRLVEEIRPEIEAALRGAGG